MTVFDVFKKANLSPTGPVRWGTDPSESSGGVYVVARINDPKGGCMPITLPLNELLPNDIEFDLEYELRRWLPNEPILYIGKTDRTIKKRLGEFRRHECGDTSPHAGGQVIKLLQCDLWLFWAVAPNPYDSEQAMIRAFKEQAGQVPFANKDRTRKKRINRVI